MNKLLLIWLIGISIVSIIFALLIFNRNEQVIHKDNYGDKNAVNWDIGSGYTIDHSLGKFLNIFSPNDEIIVHGPILKHNFNKTYIVASAKPYITISKTYNLRFNSYTDYEKFLQEYKKVNYKEYWIINKQNDNVYGPYLEKGSFKITFNKLNVPDSLFIE